MKEHFKSTDTMRSTYPWGWALWTFIWGMATHAAIPLMPAGWLSGISAFLITVLFYSGLMALGMEHYRYGRYRGAKKAFGHLVKRNKKLGW